MAQQGRVFELKRKNREGQPLWAYRYRLAGRGSRRLQRGGFAFEQDAAAALERELERLRRERRTPHSLTLSELVETYLAQHDVQPVTIEKLRWLLSKAIAVFGDRRLGELTSQEIAEWRMTVPPGLRFEATQALRQVLHRAVVWGMIDVNPARVGVDNPTPRRKEQRPFESWAELEAIAAALGSRYGPMIIFAAATGLRPAEWIALEKRDINFEERVVYVRRSFTRRELKLPKTEASLRAVPLQARALDALERLPANEESPLVFPGERGGYLDVHHFRPYQWRPAQLTAGIDPLRRIYDLRHTFATFALRAGISTFDLSRYMGARSTRSSFSTRSTHPNSSRGRWWTLRGRRTGETPSARTTQRAVEQAKQRSPLTDSNRRPLLNHSPLGFRMHAVGCAGSSELHGDARGLPCLSSCLSGSRRNSTVPSSTVAFSSDDRAFVKYPAWCKSSTAEIVRPAMCAGSTSSRATKLSKRFARRSSPARFRPRTRRSRFVARCTRCCTRSGPSADRSLRLRGLRPCELEQATSCGSVLPMTDRCQEAAPIALDRTSCPARAS